MARKPIDHLDAAVAAVVGEGNERQKKRKMTAKERYDAERVRVTYDCPRWLRAAIKARGKMLGTSASQFAMILLAWGLAEYLGGNDELREVLAEAKVLRPDALKIDCDLEIPDRLLRVIVHNDTD
jgi:hypothetical protein